jgi:RNA polymerase sigma-70 factor (ECF subfamily)
MVRVSGSGGLDDLETWLQDGYEQSFRTACLILGNRSDAEEAVQEAFLRAWRFRASLATGADVRPWLYRVVVNTCNSKLRKEIPHRDHRAAGEELEVLPAPDDVAERLAGGSDLITALQSLPVHLRVVVVLRYFADLSEKELATAIGKRPGTVKSRLHEARRLLAEHPALQSESRSSVSEVHQ